MKTPKEVVTEIFGDDLAGYVYTTPQDLVDFYISTWNEALDLAVKNADTKDFFDKYGEWVLTDVDEKSILKLKK